MTNDKNNHKRKSRRRISEIPKEIQDYYACILLHLVLPLLPIGLEFLSSHTIATTSLTLIASFYAISIGLSSKSPLQFAIGILICIVFSSVFGMISGQKIAALPIRVFASFSIFVIFVSHAVERYNRHVIDCEPFWVWFANNKDETGEQG